MDHSGFQFKENLVANKNSEKSSFQIHSSRVHGRDTEDEDDRTPLRAHVSGTVTDAEWFPVITHGFEGIHHTDYSLKERECLRRTFSSLNIQHDAEPDAGGGTRKHRERYKWLGLGDNRILTTDPERHFGWRKHYMLLCKLLFVILTLIFPGQVPRYPSAPGCACSEHLVLPTHLAHISAPALCRSVQPTWKVCAPLWCCSGWPPFLPPAYSTTISCLTWGESQVRSLIWKCGGGLNA